MYPEIVALVLALQCCQALRYHMQGLYGRQALEVATLKKQLADELEALQQSHVQQMPAQLSAYMPKQHPAWQSKEWARGSWVQGIFCWLIYHGRCYEFRLRAALSTDHKWLEAHMHHCQKPGVACMCQHLSNSSSSAVSCCKHSTRTGSHLQQPSVAASFLALCQEHGVRHDSSQVLCLAASAKLPCEFLTH